MATNLKALNGIKMLRFSTLVLSLLLFCSMAEGQDLPASGEESEEVSGGRNYALYLTPPVIGYRSEDGVIYNVMPLGLEVAIQERVGVKLNSSFLYYDSDFQSLELLVAFPVYKNRADYGQRYKGFFGGPFIRGVMDLSSDQAGGAAGIMAGYAWNLGSEGWRISLDGKVLLAETKIDDRLPFSDVNIEVGFWR